MSLPNIRKNFIPDPGQFIFDSDLDSADLRIVTWESGCSEMKAMFREGKKPYVEVAKEYYNDPTITKAHPKYGAFKSFCHGTNYLGKAANIAPRVGLIVHEAEKAQAWYFGKFPEIKLWQDRIVEQVNKTHSVSNVFGYRVVIFDRITANTYNEAVAWIPQSSVAILINKVWQEIVGVPELGKLPRVPEVEILIQVHDSLVGQGPIERKDELVKRVLECFAVPLPYDDPLTIPAGLKTSEKSWGDCG